MINLVIILFGLTMFYVAATSRLEAYVKMLAVQGFMLFLMIFLDPGDMHIRDLIFLGIETLVFKTFVIPALLLNVLQKNNVYREIEPHLPNFYSLLIVTLIFFGGFFLSFWSVTAANDIKPLHFGIAISTIITGLYIIMTRRKIITHILGYMIMENGIFLLSLSIAKEMPLIVSLGILLDIFIGIYLFAVFFNKIQSAFNETDIDTLTELKD